MDHDCSEVQDPADAAHVELLRLFFDLIGVVDVRNVIGVQVNPANNPENPRKLPLLLILGGWEKAKLAGLYKRR